MFTAVPPPNGFSAVDLLDWFDARAALATTRTVTSYRLTLRQALTFLAGEQPLAELDMRTLDVSEAARRLEQGLWANLTEMSRRTYRTQFRGGVKQFLDAAIDPDRNRPSRSEVRAALAANPGQSIALSMPSGATVRMSLPGHISAVDATFLHHVLMAFLDGVAARDAEPPTAAPATSGAAS